MKKILFILFIFFTLIVAPKLSTVNTQAQIAYVNSVIAGSGAGGTSATTVTMDFSPANFILIGVSDFQPIAVCNVTSSPANTWIASISNNDGSLTRARSFYCSPCNVSSTMTFTIGAGCGTATFPSIAAVGFSGVAASTPIDVTSSGVYTSTATTTGNGGTVTPSISGEVNITFISENGATTAPTYPTGYTGDGQIGAVGSQHLGAGLAHKAFSGLTPETPTWIWVASKATILNIAIKPANTTNSNNGFWYLKTVQNKDYGRYIFDNYIGFCNENERYAFGNEEQ
jgi:hypothetical protein